MYDIIIIGGGPAGLSAAVYAARASLRALLVEKQPMGGGQILNTSEVDNYPGLPGIGGFELGMKLSGHADRLGVARVTEEVVGIDCAGEIKKVVTAKGEYEAKALIYAAGARHRKLGAPGEERLTGSGVSYCATCDGAFFKDKAAAVIGGGDTALEDALFLARGCRLVYLVHRRDAFRAAASLQERVRQTKNIRPVLDVSVEEIAGERAVEAVRVRHNGSGEEESLAVSGAFIAVGMEPETELLRGQADLDANGYVIAGESCRSSVKGVYAAGDVRTKALRQVITAAADGANAVADFVAGFNS